MISFLGVRTDGHGFGILTWKHVGTQKISIQSSKLVVSRRSLYASPEDGEAKNADKCWTNIGLCLTLILLALLEGLSIV